MSAVPASYSITAPTRAAQPGGANALIRTVLAHYQPRRLGVGTAQFGLPYGISNRRGQVPLTEVQEILSCAARGGIGMLDTAANYGDAEAALARADIGSFRIVSKTIGVRNGVDAVVARARQSARTLGRVDMLLVHAVQDLLGPDGGALWSALRNLKDEGVVSGIGISAYVADNPADLASRFRPDVMQIPFSLLDQRLLRDGTLAHLKNLGVEIHARSVFLQGLLFLEDLPQQLRDAESGLNAVRSRILERGATPLSAALAFVLAQPEIDVAIAGVTSAQEMREVLDAAAEPLPDIDWAACALTDERVLTPSLW
jgi:aryl-alcohol dehydrogenase-like predicted oxidoreductase